MATALEDFPTWLSGKLQELKTDEDIFGSYIMGILDSDETAKEKSEALQGILSEIVENEDEITQLCNEILENWHSCKPKETDIHQMSSEEMEEKLAKLMESQSLAITKQKEYTEDEKKIREAILSQYSQMSDDEEDDTDANSTGGSKGDGLEKNMNAQAVAQAEKNKREQARIDSQKKKEKDKEDREKQKQLKEEKKEKRKTVKVERKR
ncbi:unnamed protein product [Acanthoscelides obtectus]|uniref:Coiled-coil domain-containing protein 43 n=1 Tax=Acanthoscelides obtectus TaxID=200917 RepID=A0A9P0PE78_ACAOB|nr:unnamed protein product [Acanthoscelides obtectus]CAK1641855.1 Coiled-coil domain-containing protein 43 [Acanthoscelides obtectus]